MGIGHLRQPVAVGLVGVGQVIQFPVGGRRNLVAPHHMGQISVESLVKISILPFIYN